MRVAVCGAGIAGLALAERMSALGAEVVFVERSPGPPNQGAMIDLFGAGYEAADAIGILDAIRDVSYPIGDTGLVDELGRRRAGLPYGRIAKALEDRLCRITRTDLHKVLLDNLPTNVDLRFGTSVSEVTHGDDRAVVTLDDGARLDVDLLVGADGIHSTVRALAFGAEVQYLRYLGFHFAAFVFDASDMDDTAGDHVVITDTVDRQLVSTPCAMARRRSLRPIALPIPNRLPTPVRRYGTDLRAWAGWCPRCSRDVRHRGTSTSGRLHRSRCRAGAPTVWSWSATRARRARR